MPEPAPFVTPSQTTPGVERGSTAGEPRWPAGSFAGLGVAAGLGVGLVEGCLALLRGGLGELGGAALVSGIGLASSVDGLAGGLAGAGLALALSAWRAFYPGPHPWGAGLLHGWRGSAEQRARRGSLLAGGLLSTAALGIVVGQRLADLPQRVHSRWGLAIAAATLVLGGLAAAVALTPLVAWPIRGLLRRLPGRVSAGLGTVLLLGGLAAGGRWAWEARETLSLLPWGAAGLPALWLGLLAGAVGWGRARRLESKDPVARATPWSRAQRGGGWPLLALLLLLLLGSTLALGELGPARRLAFRATRLAALSLNGLRRASDFDRDGVSPFLGGGDCAPFDGAVHPGANEVPGNGLDDDCLEGDSPRVAGKAQGGPAAAVRSLRRRLPPGMAPATNLLLVTVDALRADRLGAYGQRRPLTPRLDALAAQSVLFERFYSPSPCTRWALPTLQTGRWPSQLRWNRQPWPHEVVGAETTLAEVLRRAQFSTAAVWVFRSTMGLAQGFAEWQPLPALEEASRAPQVTDAGIEALRALADQRFYLWLHYFDPHAPYRRSGQPDLPRLGDRPQDRYDEEVSLVDREVGRLLAELDRLGLADKTAVVFTADHGEEFGEHGGQAHWGHLYDELVRLPLLIRAPGLQPRRVSDSASAVDLLPTALDLLGVPNNQTPRGLAGASLTPLLIGERDPERPAFASLAFTPTDGARARAVMVGRRKLIVDPTTGSMELYDLQEDPGERRELSEAEPQQVARLLRLLRPWMASYSPEGPPPRTPPGTARAAARRAGAP